MSTKLIIRQNCTEFGLNFTNGQVDPPGLNELQELAMVLSGLAEYRGGQPQVSMPLEGVMPITSVMLANPAAYGLNRTSALWYEADGLRYFWDATQGKLQGAGGLDALQAARARALAQAPWLPLTAPMLITKTNQVFTRTATNTAADNILQPVYSFILPGGLMGDNGSLVWKAETSFTDPATNPSSNGFVLRIGGVPICPEYTTSVAGHLFDNRGLEWHNTSKTTQKYRGSFVVQSSSATGFITTAIDTTVDQVVEFCCRWSGATPATESSSLQSLTAWIEYGA